MELFDGYMRTKNKKCIDKFKDLPSSELRTFDEVHGLSEYAGRLAPDTVLIDIDDSEQAEILMDIVEQKQLDCKVVQTTRGKHFYFRNDGSFDKCGTHKKLCCGLVADIKVGIKNSYAVLKFDGKERFVEWDTDNKNYQVAPKWLLPVKASADFINMEEGDGRDSALYGYILNLQSAGLSKDEAIECIQIINEHLLKDKMSDDEINRITRDEAFLKPVFFNKGAFLFDTFAQFLKSEHSIKRINGQLHMFKDGVYVPGYTEIEAAMIRHIPALNDAKRKEVLKYLEILIREETPATDARWIAFRNGLLNIQDDKFVDFTPDVVVTNVIPWDYNPYAYDELADRTLDRISCGDSAVRSLLEEMVGACMYRNNTLCGGKGFILTGSGSNGKSTLLNMLNSMLGKGNTTSLDIGKFDDRFSTIMMYGKLAVLSDDISDAFMHDTATFKKLVTGDEISAEQKGQPKFDFVPYCKVIASANNIPRFGKGRDSSAILRRLVIIPFNANFKKDDGSYDDPFIGVKLKEQEAIEYLIKVGIEGLKRLLINGVYTTSERLQEELMEFEESNNPVIGFFRETESSDVENQQTKDVYGMYNEYCIDNNMTPMAKGEFSKQCKKYYGLQISDKKINGKKIRIFVKG